MVIPTISTASTTDSTDTNTTSSTSSSTTETINPVPFEVVPLGHHAMEMDYLGLDREFVLASPEMPDDSYAAIRMTLEIVESANLVCYTYADFMWESYGFIFLYDGEMNLIT